MLTATRFVGIACSSVLFAVGPGSATEGDAMQHRLGVWFGLFCIAGLIILEIGCGSGSSGGGAGSNTTPAPTVTLTASPTTITKGQSSKLTWASTNATSCTASGSWSGSLATSGSESVTPSATGTFTYSINCTGSGGSANASATLTVNQRVITISVVPPTPAIPDNEIHSDYGTNVPLTINCTGCETGDTLNIQTQNGSTQTDPYSPGYPWVEVLNSTGDLFEPGPIKIWATGTDGSTSNALYYTFDGGSMVGYTDPSTGEMYYYYAGGSATSKAAIFTSKPDGTADNSYPALSASPAFTFDPGTGWEFFTDSRGVEAYLITNPSMAANIPIGEVAALDTNGGLVCAVQPNTDTAYCFMVSQVAPKSSRIIATVSFPKGSQPSAVKVLDASHAIFLTRGNSTVSEFTISGSTSTSVWTVALPQFTNADATYWQSYPFTGGGNTVLVGSTLGVMGYAVNADGTVGEKLALVNIATHTVSRYVDLPNGTVFLAADPTNNAIVAEHPDYSGKTPITALTRIYVDTGISTLLHAQSKLIPGAAIFVTQTGSNILVCVQGKCDSQLNQ